MAVKGYISGGKPVDPTTKFPTWAIILIVCIVGGAAVVGIALYYKQYKRSHDAGVRIERRSIMKGIDDVAINDKHTSSSTMISHISQMSQN